MRIQAIPARELSEDLVLAWQRIHDSVPDLASPYFHPRFTQIMAEVREDTFVGIMEEGSRPVGFFPYQRGRMGLARPVGLALSDYQAVIVHPEVEWTIEHIMRGCGLSCYDFDHLLQCQIPLTAHMLERTISPLIDLKEGYEAWEAKRMKMGGKQIKETRRRIRKLTREHEEPMFLRHSTDNEVFSRLLQWKSAQCQQTGTVDYFSMDWPRELVERIRTTESEDFGGVLAALYVGERLVAVHFCMRSRDVWHSWFPGYDKDYAPYSPGLILELSMIQQAASEGIHLIDMGKGMSSYKQGFMTGSIAIAEGRVELPSIASAARKARRGLERLVRRSPLVSIARVPGRILKKRERMKRYR